MNPTIPMPGDVSDLIGSAAQRVENRSLLLDKFVFHKKWPATTDDLGREVKWDEATRWSFMRIAEGASDLLKKEAADKRRRADGRNVEPQNRDRFIAEAKVAESLASTSWDTKELAVLRAAHTLRFLGLFRAAYGDHASIIIGQLEGRLAINLANSLIPNAGICLDRLFGLPYIPGSAIKGGCRHAALEELKNASDDRKAHILKTFCAVFGTCQNDFTKGDLRNFRGLCPDLHTDQKGAVSFLPAYPANEAKIVVDLTTVHYPDYYRTGVEREQARENPRPNPFPAVEVGGQFAFCLVLNGMNNDDALLACARRWLEAALTVRGLGGKTAAGYGWFSIRHDVLERLLANAKAEDLRRKEREEAATVEPSPEVAEKFASMKEQDLAAALNKYAYGPAFWPKDTSLVYEVTLYDFIKTRMDKLAETKNGKKAMTFLAQKLDRPL